MIYTLKLLPLSYTDLLKAKRLIFIFILLSLSSCSNNNQIEKEYDENNKLELIKYYGDDEKIDSIHYYSNNKIIKKFINHKKDTINFLVNFDKSGKIISKGTVVNKNIDFRIGKWQFYENKEVDSLVEYVNFENKSYTNQIWVRDKRTKDTIIGRGVHLKTYFKDTINLKDTLRLRFYLYEPLISYNSDMLLVLSKDKEETFNEFSEIFETERDTFYSLKNDGIPHPEIPKEVPQNHNINFGLMFEKSGSHTLQGYVSEYIKKNSPDSTSGKNEFRIFFRENIFVKDTFE